MGTVTARRVALAIGIGRAAEPDPPRRPHLWYLRAEGKRLGRSVHASPWSSKFRFGWVLGWDGLFWHRAVGWAGPDWNESSHPYYGPPPGFRREFGPLRFCSWRRRGSLRADRGFCRAMECDCPRTDWLWPIGFQHRYECPIEVIGRKIAEEERA